MKDVPPDQFFNLSDRRAVAGTMVRAITLFHEQHLYTPMLILIAAYIDALVHIGDLPPNERKYRYIQYLEEHFPDLCKAISSEDFYKYIRCGMVHGHAPSGGYVMAEDHELNGQYIGMLSIQGNPRPALNVDRLGKDFVAHAKAIAGDALAEGTPLTREDLKLRCIEEFYRLAREAYMAEHQRFDAGETKASRYLTLHAAILGVGIVGTPELIAIIAGPSTRALHMFSLGYIAFAISSLATLVLLLLALSVQLVTAPPLSQQLIDHFEKNSYDVAIQTMAKRFLQAAAEDRKAVSKKFRLIRWAFRLLGASLILAMLSAVLYVYLKTGT